MPHDTSIDRLMDALGREWKELESELRTLPVAPAADCVSIRKRLLEYDFLAPRPAHILVQEASEMLRRWTVHVTHPRYFGLFCPSTHDVTVAADALVALYNPQLASWSAAPAANEIEQHVLAFLSRRIGINNGSSHFTSGGMESNLTAVSVALANAYPELSERGQRSLSGQPLLYVSTEAHPSFFKAAAIAGLGRSAVRLVDVDSNLRLDVPSLQRLIYQDRADGHLPFLVVATAGTAAAGVVDPLLEIARLCKEESLWYHVDAAWGGGALMSERLGIHLSGIEQADSVSWDAHKWLSVPMGAGMFFCRWKEALSRAFSVTSASYTSPANPGTTDNYQSSIQWGRRFAGLKVFLTLAHLGTSGLAELIERQAGLGEVLRERLRESGWHLLNRTPLPVVCFSHPQIGHDATRIAKVVRSVNISGQAWVSPVTVGGIPAIRACITSFRTSEQDIHQLVDLLNDVSTQSTSP